MNKGRGENRNPLLDRVTKQYRVVFQLCNYRAVKAKLEGISKDEVEVAPLPWGEHVADFIVRHNNGQEYFACRPIKFKDRIYMVDGRPATQEEIETIMTWTPKKNDKPSWFMVKMEDVIDFQAEGEKLEG